MKNQIKIVAALGGISTGGAWLLRFHAAKWQRETDAMVEDLQQSAVAHSETIAFREFDALPAPVAAYFRFALKTDRSAFAPRQSGTKASFA